ncbi:heavy-metal-associated domain-containing protein [Paramaledivibacter caminithermalis]|jgi:Cu+-exporting ATPase|uniref:Copper ion binding protein n=1 Tax=Paramaledivibacter caminithermalis (strain DSM 15212 / CIP 107654 / DViRD3) TaxID=1121301 RepID=A0A1M6R259_PARC5|nr:heavy-metal-associated domain-containing protein [Paramaledivibacter caminithermalis]SHK26486.1 copper ion binding protein [Paramaledivibacter caminithermalis DSM 15212]
MKKMILIEGMSCHHCIGRVERALNEIDGVTVESISVDEKSAVITLHKEIDENVIRDTIDDAGYDVIEIREI